MKKYKVGDTIYVKGTIVDSDCAQQYLIKPGDYTYGFWFKRDAIADLPEPVKPVLPKEVGEEMSDTKPIDGITFDGYILRVIDGYPGYKKSHAFWNSNDNVTKTLMDAWYNGYTVEEKKYNVKVPHTKDAWYYKADKVYLQTICPAAYKKLRGKFTDAEIEHYGLQNCERVEVKE